MTTGYSYAYSGDPVDWDNLAVWTRTQITQEVSPAAAWCRFSNAGIIETGDNSVGVRLAGRIDYVHYRDVSTPIPDDVSTPDDEAVAISSGRGSRVALKQAVMSSLHNSAARSASGLNSTAVEITG